MYLLVLCRLDHLSTEIILCLVYTFMVLGLLVICLFHTSRQCLCITLGAQHPLAYAYSGATGAPDPRFGVYVPQLRSTSPPRYVVPTYTGMGASPNISTGAYTPHISPRISQEFLTTRSHSGGLPVGNGPLGGSGPLGGGGPPGGGWNQGGPHSGPPGFSTFSGMPHTFGMGEVLGCFHQLCPCMQLLLKTSLQN